MCAPKTPLGFIPRAGKLRSRRRSSRIFEIRPQLARPLLVEQRVTGCLEMADRTYHLQTGRVVLVAAAGGDALQRMRIDQALRSTWQLDSARQSKQLGLWDQCVQALSIDAETPLPAA
jgi:hypothetical protein